MGVSPTVLAAALASSLSAGVAPVARDIFYDALTGTAATNLLPRTGWEEWNSTAVSPATYRGYAKISTGGKGVTVTSGGVNGYYVAGKTLATASHSISFRLSGASMAATVWVGAAATSDAGKIVKNGVCITVSSDSLMLIQPRSNGVDGSSITINYSTQTGGYMTGGFPLLTGDLIRASWNAVAKTVSIYRNNRLIYTSAALTVASPGNIAAIAIGGFAYSFDEIQFEDDAIGHQIRLSEAPKVWQRGISGGVSASLAGTFTGAAPTTGVQYRVLSGVSVVADWAPLGSFAQASGAWSGVASIPDGGPYTLEIRAANRASDLEISARSNLNYVGDVVVYYGQSNAERIHSGATSTITVTPASNAWVIVTTRNAPGKTTNGPHQMLANRIAAATGRHTLVVPGGVGGQSITNLKPNVTNWVNHAAVIARASGGSGFAAQAWIHGESDVGMAGATYRGHYNDLRTGYVGIGGGRTSDQIPSIIIALGANTTDAQGATADDSWQTMRMVTQPALVTDDPTSRMIGGYHVALPHAAGDGLHLSADSYARMCEMIAQSTLAAWGVAATDGRGPLPQSATLSPDGLTVTVNVNMNGCTALSDAGATLTGWEIKSGGALITISDARVSGSTVVLTLASAQTAGTLTVYHLRNSNPYLTNVATSSASWASMAVPVAPAVLAA